MSISAASLGVEYTTSLSFAELDHCSYKFLQRDSCQSNFDGHDSYSEEEADFLSELLVKQEDVQPMSLLVDDSSESSGMQAAMSDSSTTFGDWDTDGVVPNIATSQVSSLQVPVNPTSLMLQLDYSDVISTWEALSANKKHPIKRSPSPDQLTSLQSPCMYSNPQPTTAIMDANLSLDLSSASIPSFAAPPRISARSPPASHVCCMNSQDGVPVQQHACTPRTAAEKTASLERYREKKATRQAGCSKIRYQIRKTNADNRPRFKGCFVTPSKLAELQMEAVLNGESYLPSSPMISGGSSDSTFV